MKEFMLGCNYWDSAHGTDMWRCFEKETVEKDLEALARTGVRTMRVFPNWRDFQPVKKLYAWQGEEHGYVDADERPLSDPTGVDPLMIARFREFAAVAEKNRISLLVSVMTGWMSGRLFLPPALEGKNPISDPEVLCWTDRFIRGFVNGVKDLPNIVLWDLGNESNCLGPAASRYEAYVWTAFVRNAIRASDPLRPIASGMHGLSSGSGFWTIRDQGEITDMVTTHPYASPTIKNDIEPMNRLRTTLLPTAQSVFYADLSGKAAMMEEQGGFSEALGNPGMQADFARINIYSAFVHGLKGYLWWCGMNHTDLQNAPYPWSMIERDLGMLDNDRKPKPVGDAVRLAGERIDALPLEELPQRRRRATLLLTDAQDHWAVASSAFVLAKEAGFELIFASQDRKLPESELYLLPAVTGWSVMDQSFFDAILDRVKKGASLYISYDGGHFTRFEEITGLRSRGIVKSRKAHRARFTFGEVSYRVESEMLLEPRGAGILAQNEEGNPVFSRHVFGKGAVYFLNMPLEKTLAETCDAFNGTLWYKIYEVFSEDLRRKEPVSSGNPVIGLTIHPLEEGKLFLAALNYGDREEDAELRPAPGWTLSPLAGSGERIPGCDAGFYLLGKTE